MSFTVKDGTTTVYSLPDVSGSSGQVLTSAGQGYPTTWSSLPSDLYDGQIIMWWSTANTTKFYANKGAKSPIINGKDEPDWYLCDGSTITITSGSDITLPDMKGYVPVGATHEEVCISGGNTQIIQTIPIPSHSHVYSKCQNYTNAVNSFNDSFNHSHTHTFTVNPSIQTHNYEDKTSEKQCLESFSVWTGGGIQDTIATHSHSIPSFDTGSSALKTDPYGNSSPVFNYHKLFFLIYLPSVSYIPTNSVQAFIGVAAPVPF